MTITLTIGEFEIISKMGINRFQERFDGFLVMSRLLGCKISIRKSLIGIEINIQKKIQDQEIPIANFHFICFRRCEFLNYTILEIPLDHYNETFHNPYDLYEKMDYLVKYL